MSEPSAGSDVVSMKLKAERRNDYYLYGSKMWITNGPDTDTLVVYAKADPEAGPKKCNSVFNRKINDRFLLEKSWINGAKRFKYLKLIFENCEVQPRKSIGEEGKGVNVLMSGLDYER